MVATLRSPPLRQRPETRETAREYYDVLETVCDPRALSAMIKERDEVGDPPASSVGGGRPIQYLRRLRTYARTKRGVLWAWVMEQCCLFRVCFGGEAGLPTRLPLVGVAGVAPTVVDVVATEEPP